MTAAQLVEPTGVHPRRRPVINTALPGQLTDSYSGSSKMRLKKGETFHTPTTPSSNERDPVLNIRSLPRRSPTSLEAIAASEQRMASILERLTLEDRQGDSPESTRNDLSVSQGPLDAHVGPDTPSESCPSESGREIHSKENKLQVHSYESDSGLGSSVGSRVESVKMDTEIHAGKAFTSPVSAFEAGSTSRRQLGITACKQIERYILVPILKEPKLKPFHPLVQSIPRRIVNKQVVCLRDLEKTLLWLAPVRRYAAMVRSQRVEAPPNSGPESSEHEKKPALVPSLALQGGLSKNGKAAELVLLQDGQLFSLATGLPYKIEDAPLTSKRPIILDEAVDEGVQRSMARRKKNAPPMDINQKCNHCDKVFKRPCDLTKHEKTHSRPWKCSDSTCKYFEIGWPTEKERDRHINDKHSDTPSLYKCQFQPCTYASKRESNCKQHMEKAHGWVYVRSKNNARAGSSKSGSSLHATPGTPSVATPASRSADITTPSSRPSPLSALSPEFSDTMPFNFNDPPAPARSGDYSSVFDNSPYPTSSIGMPNDFSSFNTSLNLDAFQTQFEAGDPNDLIPALEMHRQSMNSMSTPSANSVPDLTGPSMSFDGSPLATTDNNNFNFDLEWSRLGLPPMQDDYTTFGMQLPNSVDSNHHGLKPYSGDLAMGPNQGYMGYGATGKVSGLSPHAQGNLMLYSPGSGANDEHLSAHYEYGVQSQAGNDFTLYDQTPRLGAATNMTPAMHQPAPAGQSARSIRPMFPSLNDNDLFLQGTQSWTQQYRRGTSSETQSRPEMDLEYMN